MNNVALEGIDDGCDEDETEIGRMRIREIKAELEMRGVTFSDCFDRESLALRLRDARAKGKADPSILDRFNRQKVRCCVRRTEHIRCSS